MTRSFLIRLTFLLSIWLIFSSCLYTTHHFNPGKTLESGQTQITAGMGPQLLMTCIGAKESDTAQSKVCEDNTQSGKRERVEKELTLKGSFNYRLGIRDQWGPFPGVELGWHLEIPTSPASMEFNLKLAMPAPENWNMNHNLSAGWGVGAWADNSYFLEYAQSRNIRKHLLFYNTRITWLATQVPDVAVDFEKPMNQRRRFITQFACGSQIMLPDIFLLPDFIIPQGIVTFPQVPASDKLLKDKHSKPYEWSINIGTGWKF